MAKPIFCMELACDASRDEAEKFYNNIKEKLTDYHVLCYIGNSPDFKVTVLSEQNTTNGDLTEIIEYIKEKLQQ